MYGRLANLRERLLPGEERIIMSAILLRCQGPQLAKLGQPARFAEYGQYRCRIAQHPIY